MDVQPELIFQDLSGVDFLILKEAAARKSTSSSGFSGGGKLEKLGSLIQSDWLDKDRRLLSFTYRARISDPNDNVIPFPNKVDP